ncbi:MAG: molybdate transport system ATP-binding protein [Actinomycetota bacterium]|nr:molybdate transport system ATP-binding protein [Actinomycetota bacterium]
MSAGLECEVRLTLGTLDLDVTFGVALGELIVLVGPNGAGKSTLLRALAGLLPIGAGRIALDDDVLDDPATGAFVPAAHRSVGVVFQDGLLFDHLSVVENVAFGLRSRKVAARHARRVAEEWLTRLGLDGSTAVHPRQLSGGQIQRVALARALAFEPRLLLLDEPFAALDATTRVEVRRELRRHLDSIDAPKIVVTHDPIAAMALADRIIVLEAGHVTQQGSADDVRTHPRSRYVADLVGINLLRGDLDNDVVTLNGGHQLVVATEQPRTGPVMVTIHPRTIALHTREPQGAARNVWETTVAGVDDEGDRVRVSLGSPVPLVVEITHRGGEALSLGPGARVWASLKATEITVQPD